MCLASCLILKKGNQTNYSNHKISNDAFFFLFCRFTPEQLGITASTTLIWLFVEIMAILFSLYMCNVQSEVKTLDLLAFCGYKYFG